LTIVQAQELVVKWADSTFPNRNYKTAISKIMLEEMPEFLQDPTRGEWADVMILWLDVAHLLGIDPAFAIIAKMDTNSKRVFELDEESGLYHHI
jgi:predicted house-cleaning noncanonical NTP pyrophosphatase (MazG superfamily)